MKIVAEKRATAENQATSLVGGLKIPECLMKKEKARTQLRAYHTTHLRTNSALTHEDNIRFTVPNQSPVLVTRSGWRMAGAGADRRCICWRIVLEASARTVLCINSDCYPPGVRLSQFVILVLDPAISLKVKFHTRFARIQSGYGMVFFIPFINELKIPRGSDWSLFGKNARFAFINFGQPLVTQDIVPRCTRGRSATNLLWLVPNFGFKLLAPT